MQTLQQFIEKYGLTMTAKEIPARPDRLMGDSAYHYRCTIRHKESKSRMTLYFSMGSALTEPPNLEDVLGCMALDTAGYKNSGTLEEWCSEYGYDTDSREAEKIFKTVEKQADKLQLFLERIGEENILEELLWETESF